MNRSALAAAIACLAFACLTFPPFPPPAHAEKIPALSGIPADLPADSRARLAERKATLEKELAGFQAAAAAFNAKDAKDQSDAEYNELSARRGRYIGAAKAFNQAVAEAKNSAGKTRSAAECGKMRSTRDRLASGLSVQEEAIRRTEAMLEAAKRGIAEASTEKRRVIVEGVIQETRQYATEFLTSAQVLRSQVALLKDMEVSRGKRDLVIHSFNTAIFEGEGLAQAAQAGYRSGEEMRNRVDRISREILPQTYKLMMESGIAEKVGEELCEKMWGPVGALGFRGAKLSIEFTYALGKGRISESERKSAQENLDIMRGQYLRVRNRVSELERELAEGCNGGP